VTGGPGREFRIVGKAVIGGAMTGVTGPDEIGKAEAGGPVTGLADAMLAEIRQAPGWSRRRPGRRWRGYL
jgi:hypothetical protein